MNEALEGDVREFQENGYIHYLHRDDCSGGFTGVYISHTQNCCVSIIPQKQAAIKKELTVAPTSVAFSAL